MINHILLRKNCNKCFRVLLLQSLIPNDGHWEPALSLALDAALAALEGGTLVLPWPFGDSGNGAYRIYPLNLPNTLGDVTLFRDLLTALALRYQDDLARCTDPEERRHAAVNQMS